MIKNGIDISHWNNIYNFDFVAQHTDFVILKAGGSDGKKKSQYQDVCYQEYYHELNKRGVPLGAYYFAGSNFITADKGKEDAKHFLDLLRGKKFLYPVICDLEATAKSNKAGATEAVKTFCSMLEDAGYYAMVYASDISGFKERLYLDRLAGFDKWVARYGSDPVYVKQYGIHQYSSKGIIQGIIGNVDMDQAYRDYPSIMIKKHLNNF